VLIEAAYGIVKEDLRHRVGTPMHRDRDGRWQETGFAVMGMGKLGGHELNYSSDVDLIYVYASDEGVTKSVGAGQRQDVLSKVRSISNEEYFELLARDLTRALADQTHEGYVFRVDLRLRAEGSVGRLARALNDYVNYYRHRGAVWERLALLKAWPVAGSLEVGKAFVRLVKPFVLGGKAQMATARETQRVVADVKAVKEMIDGKMADRGHLHRNVKLGVGGIREIEFLVQTIQVLYGAQLPAIVTRATLQALERFQQVGLFSEQEAARLREGYCFLRDLEHKLQMVHDLQTHALPESEEELERCAVRMGYAEVGRDTSLRRFRSDLTRYTVFVHEAFQSLFADPVNSPLLNMGNRLAKTRR
jgi:glutamate-ammonia-ligase adenylyltransferase